MRYAHTALDARWFEAVSRATKALGETYISLEPSTDTLRIRRQEFEASAYSLDVSLFPDLPVVGKIRDAVKEFESLAADISAQENDPIVRKSYLDYIDNAVANARLVLAAFAQDHTAFASENKLLFGQPRREIFEAACAWIRSSASEALATGRDDACKTLAQNVLDVVPNTTSDYSILLPSELVFQKVRQLHRQPKGFYDLLFGKGGMPMQAFITQEEGDEICRRALRNIGSDYTVADAANNIWATARGDKLLLRPRGYRLERDEFIGIVSHEIGSHLLETANGERQPLRLLALGLAGHEKGHEGRAFLREQIVYNRESVFLGQFAWEYIVLLHISVCLSLGYDKEPYSFSRLYRTLHVLYAFWQQLRHPYGTNNDAWAREEAWYLAVRIQKGTDGQGGCYARDTVYLEGNIRCWELAADGPEVILEGDKGKIDITNLDHLAIIRAVNIL